MRIGSLEITLHRTVRVAEGRAPSNLPPSLGRMRTYNVKDYRKNCPEAWEDDAVFVAIHETEALWLSLRATEGPVALLVGAGCINAVTGEKLGTKLEKDNYLVAPPQPWLDGWKSEDGTVYQFVSTVYKGGEGNTVGEQLIGAESKTGGIGIAVFEPKDRSKMETSSYPSEKWGNDPYGGTSYYSLDSIECCTPTMMLCCCDAPVVRSRSMKEMGVGKGGKIIQKIYPDPYGLEAWQESPSAVSAIYLVDAETAAEITGEAVNKPVATEDYNGLWYGLDDAKKADVAGSAKFTGLKSVFAAGDTTNMPSTKDED